MQLTPSLRLLFVDNKPWFSAARQVRLKLCGWIGGPMFRLISIDGKKLCKRSVCTDKHFHWACLSRLAHPFSYFHGNADTCTSEMHKTHGSRRRAPLSIWRMCKSKMRAKRVIVSPATTSWKSICPHVALACRNTMVGVEPGKML